MVFHITGPTGAVGVGSRSTRSKGSISGSTVLSRFAWIVKPLSGHRTSRRRGSPPIGRTSLLPEHEHRAGCIPKLFLDLQRNEIQKSKASRLMTEATVSLPHLAYTCVRPQRMFVSRFPLRLWNTLEELDTLFSVCSPFCRIISL